MTLYTGGAYQGKLRLIQSTYPPEQIALCHKETPTLDTSLPVISGLHLWVWACLSCGGDPEAEIRSLLPALSDKILLCDQIGCGIVPLGEKERRWREAVGRVLQLLSGEAHQVVEVLAGIPRTLLVRQTVFLLRHGETADTAAHRYCGESDPPLSEAGRKRLADLHYPAAERYVSSDSRRAAETVRLLWGREPDARLPGLRECAFGEFEGRTYGELKEDPAYRAWCGDRTGTLSPPGGESRNAFSARVRAAFASLLARPFASCGAVTHGGVIVELMAAFFPGEKNFYEWQPACGEGYRLTFENGRPASFSPIHGREG